MFMGKSLLILRATMPIGDKLFANRSTWG